MRLHDKHPIPWARSHGEISHWQISVLELWAGSIYRSWISRHIFFGPLFALFTLQPADIMEMTPNSLPVGPSDVAGLPTQTKIAKTKYQNKMFRSWAMHDQLLLSIVQHGHTFGLTLNSKSNSILTH